MVDYISNFTARLYDDWLPAFCNAPHRDYSTEGFKNDSISKLSEFDAYWFMKAIDSNLMEQSDGFFTAPVSKAKEQIFWQGLKSISPRPVTLWIEPIITIGAIARLYSDFGWPIAMLGMQSQTWAFDLVGYGTDSKQELLVCEVKKTDKETNELIKYMNIYSDQDPLEEEPTDSKMRNAYRKVVGIRRTWPKVFWALGPNGEDVVFSIDQKDSSEHFKLNMADRSLLEFNQ